MRVLRFDLVGAHKPKMQIPWSLELKYGVEVEIRGRAVVNLHNRFFETGPTEASSSSQDLGIRLRTAMGPRQANALKRSRNAICPISDGNPSMRKS